MGTDPWDEAVDAQHGYTGGPASVTLGACVSKQDVF